jgi:DNA ligase-4
LLDDLCKATDNQAKKIILSKVFNSSTLLEHKWLLRIILKDLKIGIGHETILKNYHPDAITLYNVTSDLKEVLSELNSKDAKLGSNKFRLFYPIKPMLAGKLPLKQINTILDKTKVILETKFDGERIQVHIKEDVIKFFSRNSHNYTHIYGPKMSDIIKDNINAKSVILDGEMVVYDTTTQKTLPFGQNKTIALSEEKEVDGKHLCYKVFDILYIQGKQGEEANLMNAVIQDRKMVLSRVVKSVPTYLEVVTGKIATKMEEVCEEFNTAIMNNEEGTMVKQYDSIYAPNERGSQWVKLKGEYIDNLGDTLDLVIIGGYFGEGKRTGVNS